MSDEQRQVDSSSRLIRSPLDLGVIISVLGLLLTITVNIVTMYERVTRIETQMEAVRQSIANTEHTNEVVQENLGELRVLNYRLNKLEEKLDGDAN